MIYSPYQNWRPYQRWGGEDCSFLWAYCAACRGRPSMGVGFDIDYRVAKEVILLCVRRRCRRDARRFLPPEDFQQTLQAELARRRRRRLYGQNRR